MSFLPQHLSLWGLALCAFLGGASASTGQVFPLSENRWDNPEFVQRFLGSYGVASEVEPVISAEEQALFREVAPLIQRNPQEAINRLRRAATADASAALDYTLANLYAQTGNPGEARRYYERAIRKFPNFRRAYRNLGLVLVQANRFENAIPQLVKALELGAEEALTYGMLGYAYLNQAEPSSALEAYGKALLLNPGNIDWRQGKAQALYEAGEYAKAAALLGELIEGDPSRAAWWKLQANAFLARDMPEQAAENLEILRRMGEADAGALALLGDIYTNRGLFGLALDRYLETLEAGGTQLDFARIIGAAEALASRGAYEEATRLAKAARLRAGEGLEGERRVRLLNLEAQLALARGAQEEAAAKLEEVVAAEPLNGRALMLLADYEWRRGNYEQAAFYFERARKVDEYRVDALVEQARMRVEQGKYGAAAELLREAQLARPRENVAEFLEAVERTARLAGQD